MCYFYKNISIASNMCFHSKLSTDAQRVESRFKANFVVADMYKSSIYNGFEHPKTPIITNSEPSKIQFYEWGLIPYWAKDASIQKNTLNAKIETLAEKPSFKYVINNRCLVLADGFFEWQWLDEKGKQKQKYLITLSSNEPFAFAGLYNEWQHPSTNEIHKSYTILTTEANELMAEIHNSKKRMPVVLTKENESKWLSGGNYDYIFSENNSNLIAIPI